MVHCCVLGCKSRSERKEQNIRFYTFPIDQNTRNVWVTTTGRSNWEPTKYTRMCSKHFNTSCFRKVRDRFYLEKFSIPTLAIENSPSFDSRSYMALASTSKDHNLFADCKLFSSDLKLKNQNRNTLNWTPNETDSLCSKHFDSKCFITHNSRTSLKSSAVPILSDGFSEDTHTDAEISPLKLSKSSSATSSLSDDTENALLKISSFDTFQSKTVMSAVEEAEPAFNGDGTNNKHECRTCLQSSDPHGLFRLFKSWSPGWGDMESTIAEDLERIANIQVSEMDKHSQFICISCSEQLRAACQFVSLVQKSDKILKQRHSTTDSINCEEVWPKPIQIDKPVALENLLDVEVKQEVLSDDEFDCFPEEEHIETDFDDQVEIKVEPEEFVGSALHNITINGHCTVNSINIESMENGDSHFSDEFFDGKVKEEPISDNEDIDSAPADVPLECLLCTKTFVSVSGLKAHVIAQHSYKTVKRKVGDSSPQKPQREKFTCAICKRSFSTTTDLMVHETCHNKDVCYGCNAKFDSFDKLIAHRKRCKALLSKEVVRPKTLDDVVRPVYSPSENAGISNRVEHQEEKTEEPQMLSCDLCSEQFSDSYYMTIHKEIHHSKDNSDTQLNNETTPMEIETLENIFNEDS